MSAAPAYPKRDKMFATRLMRLAFECCLAQKIGQDGVAFLLAIASWEDHLRYAGPVQIPQIMLQAQAGIKTHKGFVAVRKRLVETGWLVYVPGTRTQAPQYWVAIPGAYQRLFESRVGVTTPGIHPGVASADEVPSGDIVGDEVPDEVPDYVPDEVPSGDIVGDEVPDEVPDYVPDEVPSGDTKRDTYNPIPKPKHSAAQSEAREAFKPESVEIPPELDTPAFREAWGDWIKHRREKGARLTPLSVKRQFNKFVRAGPTVSVQAIDEAITAGWTSVWPEKVKGSGRSNEARNNAGASYQPRSGPRKI